MLTFNSLILDGLKVLFLQIVVPLEKAFKQ